MILEILEEAMIRYDPCADGEVLKAEEGGHVGVGRPTRQSQPSKQNK
jgi:hypothetical protein